MNKLPTKQIYLLSIIVVGLITLSVYSTYAIFTFESSTSDVVSINTPDVLTLSTTATTYKQLTVAGNSYVTTDVDIYNSYEYDLCYSIWYHINEKDNIDKNKVKIHEVTNSYPAASGLIEKMSSRRIPLIIINDNEETITIKIGLVHEENRTICNLELTADKEQVSTTITGSDKLSKKVIDNTKDSVTDTNYLTYKNQTDVITLDTEKTIYIATEFTYRDEVFTLKEPIEVTTANIEQYIKDNTKKYYTCLYESSCQNTIMAISEINEKPLTDAIKTYEITKYDLLKGYMTSQSGLRKVDNNYYFYGDNPNNFVYYNCLNEFDSNTCELWRILGFIHDNKTDSYITKIIRDSSIGEYSYDETVQTWNDASISKYLTKEYKLVNTAYLKEITFKQENLLDLNSAIADINYLTTDNKTNISLMNLTDYVYASTCEPKKINEYDETCLKTNWLNDNQTTSNWTMTVKYEEPTPLEEENQTPILNDSLYTVGNTIATAEVSTKLNVKPVVYLKERIFTTAGNGSIDNPYVII